MDRAEEARQLRRSGMSRSQIAESLGMRSGGTALDRWLRGVPPPAWTRRPNAKDDLRKLAVEMRQDGFSYRQILQSLPLPVSKSTLSLWLRDVPLSDEQRAALDLRRAAARAERSRAVRAQRIRRQTATIGQARDQVKELAESELFVAGLTAYWAEGSKAKPWRAGGEHLTFINSDPDMIRLFLAWLDLIGVARDRLVYRLSIHETADVKAALDAWAAVVGVPSEVFAKASLKRHNPKTHRGNTGADYLGCLTVYVRRSTDLYRQVAGWWAGLSRCVGEQLRGQGSNLESHGTKGRRVPITPPRKVPRG